MIVYDKTYYSMFMSFNFRMCSSQWFCPGQSVLVKKQLKYFLSHECKSPSKESSLGMCTIISEHGLAWSHKCWQFLPLGTMRQWRLPDKCCTWLTSPLSVHRTSVTQGITSQCRFPYLNTLGIRLSSKMARTNHLPLLHGLSGPEQLNLIVESGI